MSKFEEIIKHLSHNFDQFDDFLQIELKDFSVIDYKGQSYIIINIQTDNKTFIIKLNGVDTPINDFDDTKLFNINNVSNTTGVGFVPIDGKMGLLGFGDSYCDFVFFDENNFCFVEFKLNATSSNEKAVEKRRIQAINQLEKTIDKFDEKLDKDYKGLTLEAYVCTPEFYRNPKFKQSWQYLAKRFKDTYDIELFESNHKTCK